MRSCGACKVGWAAAALVMHTDGSVWACMHACMHVISYPVFLAAPTTRRQPEPRSCVCAPNTAQGKMPGSPDKGSSSHGAAGKTVAGNGCVGSTAPATPQQTAAQASCFQMWARRPPMLHRAACSALIEARLAATMPIHVVVLSQTSTQAVWSLAAAMATQTTEQLPALSSTQRGRLSAWPVWSARAMPFVSAWGPMKWRFHTCWWPPPGLAACP